MFYFNIFFILQETLFNVVAAFGYLSSSSYLGFAVKTFLYPLYLVTPYFQVYPAMTAAYVSIETSYVYWIPQNNSSNCVH